MEALRGRCAFRQYMPKKLARYGIKIFSLACAKTYYTQKLEIYCGQQPEGPYRQDNSAFSIMNRMVEPISQTGRNVTVDNWFMSVPVADHLLNVHRLTIVGTIRKNKPEIPPVFLDSKIRPECSSMFAYRNEGTLLSYCPKKID